MKNIQIKKINPSEWEIYKTIRLQALKDHPIAFADTYEKASAYPSSMWSGTLADPSKLWLFAFDGEKAIGSLGAYLNVIDGVKVAIPVGVYVANEYKGKGIGKSLMAKLIEEIEKHPEIKKIKLWVAATQKPAMGMYQSFGFEFIGKEKEPIIFEGQEIEELIMEKYI